MSSAGLPSEADVRTILLQVLRLRDRSGLALSRDMAEWDSLKHMEIVFALEDRYGVRFDESEFATLTTPIAIVSALRRHLAA